MKKASLANIEKIKNLGYEFITPYQRLNVKVSLRCKKCNRIFTICPASILYDKSGCKCRKKVFCNYLSTEEISQRLKKKGFELISKEYYGREKPILVRCICGNIFETTFNRFEGNGSVSCGCRKVGRPTNIRVVHEISQRFMTQYKTQARNRGLTFNITAEYIWDMFLSQNKLCKLTGELLEFSKKTQTFSDTTVSIDRINTSLGYVSGNVRIIHKVINKIKWDFDDSEFLTLCNSVVIQIHKRYHKYLLNHIIGTQQYV
jgi:hypothetical protein